jgi:hypothetical protein
LGAYRNALLEGHQHAAAQEIAQLAEDWRRRFVKIVPARSRKASPVLKVVETEIRNTADDNAALELVDSR